MITIYNYHPDTGELVNSREARLDPKDNLPLVPRYATLAVPPGDRDGMIAVFADNEWSMVTDLRGAQYWDETGERFVIDALGEDFPDGALLVAPAPPVATLDDYRATARKSLLAAIQAFVDLFTQEVSVQELASWSTKADLARAHLAGTEAPSIVVEAALTGEDPDDLAALVVSRADQYVMIVGQITGLRRKAFTIIAAASAEVDVDVALAEAIAAVDAMAAAAIPQSTTQQET